MLVLQMGHYSPLYFHSYKDAFLVKEVTINWSFPTQ